MISGDNVISAMAHSLISRAGIHDRGLCKGPRGLGGSTMLVRPRELADRMSGIQPPEIFTLPIDAARLKARQILNQFPQVGYTAVVENWRQLPDGQIEFTMRHLPTAD